MKDVILWWCSRQGAEDVDDICVFVADTRKASLVHLVRSDWEADAGAGRASLVLVDEPVLQIKPHALYMVVLLNAHTKWSAPVGCRGGAADQTGSSCQPRAEPALQATLATERRHARSDGQRLGAPQRTQIAP